MTQTSQATVVALGLIVARYIALIAIVVLKLMPHSPHQNNAKIHFEQTFRTHFERSPKRNCLK